MGHPEIREDATTGDEPGIEELEPDVRSRSGKHRNASTEQDRMDVQPHLVDEICVEERSSELASAHQANAAT